jgi:hypothetical protein
MYTYSVSLILLITLDTIEGSGIYSQRRLQQNNTMQCALA